MHCNAHTNINAAPNHHHQYRRYISALTSASQLRQATAASSRNLFSYVLAWVRSLTPPIQLFLCRSIRAITRFQTHAFAKHTSRHAHTMQTNGQSQQAGGFLNEREGSCADAAAPEKNLIARPSAALKKNPEPGGRGHLMCKKPMFWDHRVTTMTIEKIFKVL